VVLYLHVVTTATGLVLLLWVFVGASEGQGGIFVAARLG